MCRVCCFGVDPQVCESLLHDLRFQHAFAHQFGERGGDDAFGVDFKVAAQMLAIVGAAEAVGAERDETRPSQGERPSGRTFM